MHYDIMFKYPLSSVEIVEDDLDFKTAKTYLKEYRESNRGGEGFYYVRQHKKERA